jgi:hypothetical protein
MFVSLLPPFSCHYAELTQYLIASFEFTERSTSGIAPFLELPVTTQVNDYLITFGGWDGKEMNSELHFFNTST